MLRRLIPSLLMMAACGFAADTTTTTYNVPYEQNGIAFEGKLVVPNPAGLSQPAIVLFPDWMGVSARSVEDAQRIAQWGYVVFVADLYGKKLRPKNAQQAGKLAGALKADVVALRRQAEAAFRTAKRQTGVDTGRVALLGYCFGGNAALELARAGAAVRGTASVHGNLKTPFPADAGNIRGRTLVLHGADDPFVPPAEVEAFRQELDSAGKPLKFVAYPGAVHAFTNPGAGTDPTAGRAYNPQASEAAYRELETFFAEVFRP